MVGPSTHARTVFDVIAGRLCERAAVLRSFACTNRSFEEWINWESFHALEAAGFNVRAKPAYERKPSAARAVLLADLGVIVDGRIVVVEVAACSDATQGKWAHKIRADAVKLVGHVTPPDEALQVVVLVSGNLQTAQWAPFLKMIRWDEGTPMHANAEVATLSAGTGPAVTVRGWTGRDLKRRG